MNSVHKKACISHEKNHTQTSKMHTGCKAAKLQEHVSDPGIKGFKPKLEYILFVSFES